MGKNNKEKKEANEKRESFADRQTKQKRKNMLIGIGVLIVVAAIVGYASLHFIEKSATTQGFGKLGDDHQHASILVRIHGDKFDFSRPDFQVKNAFIHFEGQDGDTIHRHATGVPLGFLFETIKVGLSDECFVFPDRKPEHTFCTDEDYSLKFYVNHKKVDSITDYVIQEDDRILISYGNQSQEEIDDQLRELDAQVIRR
ncbi:MAG: protein-disulfide isomerase [Candidatus Nitrosotenuis sp.]|uniref:Protein-disulfide isomerase n=1 Tax=Candidatus Nitrosotenuis uzonensis TaxID=1407055 RepID=A0A812F385_9ARCH|nr:protein-disulfide isomerase [Candidatus Nitrosotenuis uzonensis]MCA2003379.1 protein-disulfide isomerase [Candidatus Nitrosotenuis sp.]CAE6498975.1 conserved hypothetical protein [Candidatus Nitrosotenuis uzonensis]